MCMILIYVKSCVVEYGARKIIAMLNTWKEPTLLSSLSVGFLYKSI